MQAFVSQVEHSANQQLKSKSSPWLLHDSPIKKVQESPIKKVQDQSHPIKKDQSIKKSSSSRKSSSAIVNPNPEAENKKKMEDPKSIILAAAKNPNAAFITDDDSPPPALKAKPQFYFGQPMTELVKKSSISNNGAMPSAIEKVKLNEALTHPKRAEHEAKLETLTSNGGRGGHTSIINVSEDKKQFSGKIKRGLVKANFTAKITYCLA